MYTTPRGYNEKKNGEKIPLRTAFVRMNSQRHNDPWPSPDLRARVNDVVVFLGISISPFCIVAFSELRIHFKFDALFYYMV